MTRWTPELIERVRQQAAAGRFKRQAADFLLVSETCLSMCASKHKIKFHGVAHAAKRERAATTPVLDWIEPSERLRTAARLDLDREIAAARAEASSAPLYRRGWP